MAAACPDGIDAPCERVRLGPALPVRCALPSRRPACGTIELVHGVERLLESGSAGKQAVIAHNQGIMRPKIPHDALVLA
jgi:hypothetical protein